MIRYVTPALVLVAFAVGIQSLRASPPTGAVVQTWHYDAARNELTIRVLNTSQKDITGYKVSVETTLSNGARGHFTTEWDKLGAIVRNEPDALFPPGGHEDRTIPIGTTPNNPTTGVNDVHLVLVVYGDETAEAEDDKSLADLFSERRGTMSALQKLAGAVKKVLDNPDDEHPSATALKEVNALIAMADSQGGAVGRAERMVFLGAVQNLKQARTFAAMSNPPLSERDWMQAHIVKRTADEAAAFAPHVEIRRPQ
jgi:hypothetical protein